MPPCPPAPSGRQVTVCYDMNPTSLFLPLADTATAAFEQPSAAWRPRQQPTQGYQPKKTTEVGHHGGVHGAERFRGRPGPRRLCCDVPLPPTALLTYATPLTDTHPERQRHKALTLTSEMLSRAPFSTAPGEWPRPWLYIVGCDIFTAETRYRF